MRSGEIRGEPSNQVIAAFKLIYSLTGTNLRQTMVKNKRSLGAIVPQSNTINSKAMEPRQSVLQQYQEHPEWSIRARIHLFLRIWAELNATVMFMATISVAHFTKNGRLFPFSFDRGTWIRSMIFAGVNFGTQFIAVCIAIFNSSISHWKGPASLALVNAFQTGYEMLQETQFCVFSAAMSATLAALTESIFLQQVNAAYNLYS